MIKAVIDENGIVENLIVIKDDAFTIAGKTLVPSASDTAVGMRYVNGAFEVDEDAPTPDLPPPSDIEIRLAALETKVGITPEDKAAALSQLVSIQVETPVKAQTLE